MCKPTVGVTMNKELGATIPPIQMVLPKPSLLTRYACAGTMMGFFALWGSVVFVDEKEAPGIGSPLHSYKVPLLLTSLYLLGLPLLRALAKRFLSENIDVKILLKETMIVYNGGQVLINGWMVYKMIDAVLNHGHPFFGDVHTLSGASFACWVHYMDKYLEFFDTVFMVLRGRMDQVRTIQNALTKCCTKLSLTQENPIIGIFSSCVSPRFDCMGLVVCNRFLARG